MEVKELNYNIIGSVIHNQRGYTIIECSYCNSIREIRNDAFKGNKFANCSCIEKSMFVNKVYGRLKILDIIDNDFLCECQCESRNIKRASKKLIKNGHVKSCGCLLKQRKNPNELIDKRLHNIWSKMKQRCNNVANKDYHSYGGRGIKICDEWAYSFKDFIKWAYSSGYTSELTIERMNVNKDYEPCNCTWISNEAQANNRRTSNFVVYESEIYNITQLAKKLSINRNRVYKMLKLGSIQKLSAEDYERIGGIGSTIK